MANFRPGHLIVINIAINKNNKHIRQKVITAKSFEPLLMSSLC